MLLWLISDEERLIIRFILFAVTWRAKRTRSEVTLYKGLSVCLHHRRPPLHRRGADDRRTQLCSRRPLAPSPHRQQDSATFDSWENEWTATPVGKARPGSKFLFILFVRKIVQRIAGIALWYLGAIRCRRLLPRLSGHDDSPAENSIRSTGGDQGNDWITPKHPMAAANSVEGLLGGVKGRDPREGRPGGE